MPMKMEPTVSYETSSIRTQTPENYSKKKQITFRTRRKLKNKKIILFLCTADVTDTQDNCVAL